MFKPGTYPAGNDLIVALILLVKNNTLANWHLANTILSQQHYDPCGVQLIDLTGLLSCFVDKMLVNLMAFDKKTWHITKIWVSSTNNCSNWETYPAGNDLIVALIHLVKKHKNTLANLHLAKTMLSRQCYDLCGLQLIDWQASCDALLTKCLSAKWPLTKRHITKKGIIFNK